MWINTDWWIVAEHYGGLCSTAVRCAAFIWFSHLVWGELWGLSVLKAESWKSSVACMCLYLVCMRVCVCHYFISDTKELCQGHRWQSKEGAWGWHKNRNTHSHARRSARSKQRQGKKVNLRNELCASELSMFKVKMGAPTLLPLILITVAPPFQEIKCADLLATLTSSTHAHPAFPLHSSRHLSSALIL